MNEVQAITTYYLHYKPSHPVPMMVRAYPFLSLKTPTHIQTLQPFILILDHQPHHSTSSNAYLSLACSPLPLSRHEIISQPCRFAFCRPVQDAPLRRLSNESYLKPALCQKKDHSVIRLESVLTQHRQEYIKPSVVLVGYWGSFRCGRDMV